MFSSWLLAVVAAGAAGPRVLVVYSTETNHTKSLGEAIASGAAAASCASCVRVLSVPQMAGRFEEEVLEWADALVIGSPTHYGNPSAELLGWVEKEWEAWWLDERLGGKRGAVFATGGGVAQGVEHVLSGLARLLESFRFSLVMPDPTRSGYTSYGAVAVTGTPPWNTTDIAPGFREAAVALGADVVAAVQRACA